MTSDGQPDGRRRRGRRDSRCRRRCGGRCRRCCHSRLSEETGKAARRSFSPRTQRAIRSLEDELPCRNPTSFCEVSHGIEDRDPRGHRQPAHSRRPPGVAGRRDGGVRAADALRRQDRYERLGSVGRRRRAAAAHHGSGGGYRAEVVAGRQDAGVPVRPRQGPGRRLRGRLADQDAHALQGDADIPAARGRRRGRPAHEHRGRRAVAAQPGPVRMVGRRAPDRLSQHRPDDRRGKAPHRREGRSDRVRAAPEVHAALRGRRVHGRGRMRFAGRAPGLGVRLVRRQPRVRGRVVRPSVRGLLVHELQAGRLRFRWGGAADAARVEAAGRDARVVAGRRGGGLPFVQLQRPWGRRRRRLRRLLPGRARSRAKRGTCGKHEASRLVGRRRPAADDRDRAGRHGAGRDRRVHRRPHVSVARLREYIRRLRLRFHRQRLCGRARGPCDAEGPLAREERRQRPGLDAAHPLQSPGRGVRPRGHGVDPVEEHRRHGDTGGADQARWRLRPMARTR